MNAPSSARAWRRHRRGCRRCREAALLCEDGARLAPPDLRPATLAPMAKEKKRGRGRPPLDPDGSVELRVRVTKAQAEKAERVARAKGFIEVVGPDERPILAAAVRLMVDAYPEA